MDLPGAFAMKKECPCCFKPGSPFCDNPSLTPSAKLSALRVLMAENDLDAYLVLSEDAHNSEYVSPCDERRSYLTGFSGSAGVALVTAKSAFLYTDSRYYLQAARQLPTGPTGDLWVLKKQDPGMKLVDEDIFDLLSSKKVGVDPAVFPHTRAKQWKKQWAEKSEALLRSDPGNKSLLPPVLVPVLSNLVDSIWPTRPAVPCNPISLHSLSLAGSSSASKLSKTRAAMRKASSTVLVLTALDQIGWLFNLRGSDILCNPVFFSYSLVTLDHCHLFLCRGALDLAAVPPSVASHLSSSNVTVHQYSSFSPPFISSLLPPSSSVLVEKGTCSLAVANAVEEAGCAVVETENAGPVEMMKAVKNGAEIEGM